MDSAQPLTVSAVVPTRNRRASLERALRALGRQSRTLDEVVLVDASDEPVDQPTAAGWLGARPVRVVTCEPSVCRQRNLGIAVASSSHVLLCDDDIEPGPDYLAGLSAYIEDRPGVGAVSGLLREPGSSEPGFAPASARHLLFAFVFQLDVHADVGGDRRRSERSRVFRWLAAWYAARGNTLSKAGWPLITQVKRPVTTTAIYGLGAALVRRDWLLKSPYDEGLGPHGVGDNYGVALGFPGREPIHVLVDLPVVHHREPLNRRPPADAFLDRVLAIDRFLEASGASRAWLAWSLLGRAGWYLARGPRLLAATALRGAWRVVTRRNPLAKNDSGVAAERAGLG